MLLPIDSVLTIWRYTKPHKLAGVSWRTAYQIAMSRMIYCAANWPSTSLQADDSEPALVARHCTIRPPPGATPPQIARTSAPQADRSTNSSSRGRIGRARCGAATARGRHRLLAGRRKLCLVLFQALQRRCAAGRHARAHLWIVGAAGAADRGRLRAAGLFCRSRRCGLRRRHGLGGGFCSGRRSGCRGRGLGRGRSRRFEGAHRALAGR